MRFRSGPFFAIADLLSFLLIGQLAQALALSHRPKILVVILREECWRAPRSDRPRNSRDGDDQSPRRLRRHRSVRAALEAPTCLSPDIWDPPVVTVFVLSRKRRRRSRSARSSLVSASGRTGSLASTRSSSRCAKPKSLVCDCLFGACSQL